jgi:hypothetical protein
MPRKNPPESPLYVKLPQNAVEKLQRAAEELGIAKKDIVAGLLTKYLEPSAARPMVGTYSFQPYDPPEIMNAEQAGQFLQIEEKNVVELAEGGKLPGKKLGPVWRFSREALVAWLSTPDQPEKKR